MRFRRLCEAVDGLWVRWFIDYSRKLVNEFVTNGDRLGGKSMEYSHTYFIKFSSDTSL